MVSENKTVLNIARILTIRELPEMVNSVIIINYKYREPVILLFRLDYSTLCDAVLQNLDTYCIPNI